MNTAKPTPTKASTQDFVAVVDIKDDVVMLRDFSCCLIIEVGTTNFELLSEEEKQSLVDGFASLLNSLSFPLQIAILSKQMDISKYVDFVEKKIVGEADQTLKGRLVNYRDFIKSVIKKNTVMEKRFYCVVPFSQLELGIGATTTKGFNPDYVFSRARVALYPKRDNLLRLLLKVGLSGKTLQNEEITTLFYNLFNPDRSGQHLANVNSSLGLIKTT